jgi:acetyl esterase
MDAIPAPAADLTPESRAYLDRLVAVGAPLLHTLTPPQARANAEAAIPVVVSPTAAEVTVSTLEVAGAEGPLPARLYRPSGAPERDAPGIVYLHGGGWVLGTLDGYDDLCRRLADASGGVVVSIDYRLAPEHPFPAPVEDAVAAYRDVAARAADLGLDARRLAVGGDSAGGALSTAVARRATREEWDRQPAGQLLIYPATEGRMDHPSVRAFGEGHYLTELGMRWFYDHYVQDRSLVDHPDVSPLRADDLAGSARAHILVASHDPLRDEGVAYARALEAAGVSVTVTMAQGMLHGYVRWTALIPEAARDIVALGEVLREWWRQD